MASTIVRVRVGIDGGIHIPSTMLDELGIAPTEEVQVMVIPLRVNKPVTPVQLTDEDRVRLKRIGELIEETFKGMDMEYVREGRRDRWL
jgi:bifunctional DNA-binding transcriptional regulator/antitoxin component of YhaV-PrlF toxin-antitoxin module